MIMDKRLEFCDATALNTGAAGAYLIGDQPDLYPDTATDVGQGQPMYLVIQVDTTATSGGSATASFSLRSDATAAVHVSTSTLHVTSPVWPVADLVAGFQWITALPMGQTYERFLGIVQTTGTAAFTAGKINAFLTLDPHGWRAYPEGQN